MNYYFDESGNWDEPAPDMVFVIGGLCASQTGLDELTQAFMLIKSDHGLTPQEFHAADMPREALYACYEVLARLFGNGGLRGLFRVLEYQQLRKSRSGEEDVYFENAAEVVARLIAGDSAPSIFYDLKFYHNHPASVANIMSRGEHNHSRYLNGFRDRYHLLESAVPQQRIRILGKLQNAAQKRDLADPALLNCLQQFEQTTDPVEMQVLVESYDWAELWVNFYQTERERERFRSRISEKNASFFHALLPCEEAVRIVPQVRYLGKKEDNPGIQAVDILCNALYRWRRGMSVGGAFDHILTHLILEEEAV